MPGAVVDACGTRHAFLDLGANDGQSLGKFRRDWLPLARGPYTHVVAFEMNTFFRHALQAALQPLTGELVEGAVWTTDGSMTANMQMPGSRVASKNGVLYNMTSSALAVGGVALNKHAKRQVKAASTHERSMSVRTIDFARWLSTRFCRDDTVEVKMDIEGAEFEVLEHLLRTGSAPLIDTLAIEWHTSKRGQGGAKALLMKRQAKIASGLTRAGCKVIEWKM